MQYSLFTLYNLDKTLSLHSINQQIEHKHESKMSFLCSASYCRLTKVWGQGFRIYNSDGTVMQFSLRTDSIVFYDGIGSDQDFGPFTSVNQCIAGTWYKSKYETVTFNEDGTTDYIAGATYRFLPYQGSIIIYNPSGAPVNILKVHDLANDKMIVSTLGSESFKVWSTSRPIQFVTDIILSDAYLRLQPDDTKRITANIFPNDADNPDVSWKSSNESVAMVIDNGLVVALADGSCTISCLATDGSGVYAECYVKVGNNSQSDSTSLTCSQAVELTSKLPDGTTSAEVYTVTGYITEVVGSVSRNQQTFWMADTKDGGKVFEAYWANLPEGVSEFKVGMKVEIFGKLYKYVTSVGSVFSEMKNATVVILENVNDEPTPVPGGDKVTELVNGGFEEWSSDSVATGWKSASTASNATTSKSTDAHSGNLACKIHYSETTNKRLATQEITLKAGTYSFSFYAKASTTEPCQSRCGFVPVNADNAVGTYKYGDYVNNVSSMKYNCL